MNSKCLIIFILLLSSCSLRDNLKPHIYLNYIDNNSSAELILDEKITREYQKTLRYYYYGTLSFSSKMDSPKKVLFLVNGDEKSKIYLDTIASVRDDWYYSSSNNLKNKIYVVFSSPEIDWSSVKIVVAADNTRELSLEKGCALVSKGSVADIECKKLKKTR